MMPRMRLSYSAYKVYLQCPLEFWHSYIAYTTPPTPDNRINSLYGSAIGEVFESFYTDKLWMKGTEARAALHDIVEPTVDRIMAQEVKKGGVYDWVDVTANYHSRVSLIQDIHGDIDPVVETIKLHRFLGPIADAEVILDTEVRGHLIRGRADFIVKRTAPFHDLVIIDGKGSKHRGRYVDGMQLRWYAMLYKLRYRQPPDTLAFLFWRFPPAKAVDWVPFDNHGLDSLLNDVVAACDRIEADKARLDGAPPQYGQGPFQPIPEEGHCRFCSYKDLCPAAPKKPSEKPLPGVDNDEYDISLLDL